jgi:hypothetical protein
MTAATKPPIHRVRPSPHAFAIIRSTKIAMGRAPPVSNNDKAREGL